MRQAGRALPEYRELKEKHSFLELVQTPELAAEVTLQPVRRFGFDAAILFSDILVIPEAMGQPYRFRETGGMVMDFAVRTKADIERLSVERVVERLGYVDQALRLLRKELGDQTALIGFSGSPWTLATFMMEGGSAEKYTRALNLFREDRKTFHALAEKLTAAVTAYLQMQISAGVDALQIFDSHGGQLAPTEFQEASGRWMRDIIAGLDQRAAGILPADQASEKSVLPTGRRQHVKVFPSSFFPSARTAIGTICWRPARACWALTGNFRWPTRAGCCRRTSPCKAILRPRCSATPRRKLSPGKRGPCWRPCAAAKAIFSTWATACRPTRNWKTSPRWSRRCKISNDERRPDERSPSPRPSPPGEGELFAVSRNILPLDLPVGCP